ncbi:3-oxoacyl-ACP synthase [Paraburkholderia tropica]|uniref:3-oxoacyl-ACP synthase n=1 Tax=Paraburkholderia tropica TaxID=92647 RepID=UPI00160060E0|nr:3-oxoacyl-ACP synthase [Paraburkholderia tropica]QNB16128.1 3-oxoacyl-ACP synthase [Paraburkholderia tropica]
MNIPVITALTAWVPQAIPLPRSTTSEPALRRANAQPGWDVWTRSWHPDYGYWREAGPQTWPDKRTDTSRPVHSGPPPADIAWAVPVATGMDLSGFATKVAISICTARAHNTRPVDVVMFCHSTPDEHVPATIAGRLRAEIGAPCFPFSLSQQHGVSPFTALRLAHDLLVAEPDVHTILIVAAEKWCPPFSRICEPGIMHGDAAAALLVERADHSKAGLLLLDVAARHVPGDIRLPTAGAPDAWALTLKSMIGLSLMRHGLQHNDIHDVVGPPGVPSLTDAVYALLRRPHASVCHQACAHLGAAEAIARLAHTLSCCSPPREHRVLLWGYGIGGFVGTALLEAHGAPAIYQPYDVRPVS